MLSIPEPRTDGAVAIVSLAPAKVNLSLHVLGRKADGFHKLESLVAFAYSDFTSRTCDVLKLTADVSTSLAVEGPTADHAGPIESNLILKAAQLFRAKTGAVSTGRFHLTKRLPAAAGIGGGSADAAAALRLLADLNDIPLDSPELFETAKETGSDVPVCLGSQARFMAGTGDCLEPPTSLPPLHAVLLNPRVAVNTREVFEAAGYHPETNHPEAAHPRVAEHFNHTDLLALLGTTRNDLEPAAIRIAPIIGDALDLMRATRDCILARMSGSGATVFGIYPTEHTAFQAWTALRMAKPHWWVEQTVLA